MKIQIFVTLLGAMLLSGCSSTGLFLLNSSLRVGAEHTVAKDITYGKQAWQRLDVHRPKRSNSSPLPVLVFFYGGSWDSGHKEMYFFVANSFAKRGYVVVIPDYVKYPQARFPDFMHDGAAAVDWVLSNIGDYGGDPQKVVIAGHSAGAHLGALLLSDPQYLGKLNRKATEVRGFAGLAGPYNFTPTSKKLLTIFGPPGNLPNMQVNTFVDGDEPEMLLLHGAKDSTVGVMNQTSLQAALQQAEVPVSTKVYDDVGHIKILMTLTPPLTGGAPTLDDMHDFFQRVVSTDGV